MYKRALSAYWKQIKRTEKFPYLHDAFSKYIINKIFGGGVDYSYLEKMKNDFLKLDNVRKMR